MKDLLLGAHAAVREKDYAKAESLLREALKREPTHLDALDLLGFVLFFSGRVAEAEAVCRTALEVAPEHPYALKGRGLCLAKLGRVDEGVASLRHAIERAPSWRDPRWDLLVVLTEAKRFDEAKVVLDEARRAQPQNSAAWAQMEGHLNRCASRT